MTGIAGSAARVRRPTGVSRHKPAVRRYREDIGQAKEFRDEHVLRLLVHIGDRSDLAQPAAVHHGDAVAHHQRLMLVVRDEDEGHAEPLLHAQQLDLQLRAQLGIECRERLVEQHHLGFVDQRAGEGDALALAAGQLRRVAIGEGSRSAASPSSHRRGAGARLSVCRAYAARTSIFCRDRQMRKQGVGLEHGVHRPLVRRDPVHCAAGDHHTARIGRFEPGDHPQQGGFAAAGRSEQGEELAGPRWSG